MVNTSRVHLSEIFLNCSREENSVFIPGVLPLHINPRAKISKDGRIENLSEFKTVDDVFNFSCCLHCPALQQEHYGSSGESPCMKCFAMVRKIEEMNKKGH
ncbi:MAG: hypothetical protein HY052_00095 [Proteobacteria bacterium]|nr:hypothetical protein [Pseudomonadota bacterium]